MKQVLIPTDFSKNAWNAISYALEFYKNEVCIFYFLHTYTPSFYRADYIIGGPSHSAIPDVGVMISLMGLEKTLKDAREQFSNEKHSYEILSAFNLLTDEIKKVCKKKNIDIIVMGTQGATGAKEIFLGTHTVYTIRKTKTPILIIPKNYGYKPIHTILFPTDYWSRYKEGELKPILDLAKMQGASITVLHATEEDPLNQKQKKNKAFLDLCLDEIPHTFEEVEQEYMPDVINRYIKDNDMDFLVMMNRKHSFFERLMFKQNVDAIGFHCTIPFLVIRDTSKISK
ncbi:MAG: universal stress protein [Bacteroidota bacterium]